MTSTRRMGITMAAVGLGLALTGTPAGAHCDTMDGPVVEAARRALARRDVTPVLRWVRSGDEAEVRAAFEQVLSVRAFGAQAQALADRYFFETVVRLHRAGEGEPFTGLKPAGTAADPAVAAADLALEQGSPEALTAMLSTAVADGIRRRFDRARLLRARADDSVEAGREFVAAYVEFTHYVENVHRAARGAVGHAAEEAPHAVAEGGARVK